MSPIIYIEARCDECSDEITSAHEAVVIALLRNGKLVCQTCRDKRPRDQVVKNFSIPKMPEPEDETPFHLIPSEGETPEEKPEDPTIVDTTGEFEGDEPDKEPEEPDAIDRAREEQQDRKC